MKTHVRRPRTISRGRRWALYIVGTGVWLTGGVWLLFHYFLVEHGEFGPETNPLEPWWLKLHGAFAFAAVWLFGLLWAIHITKLWHQKRRRQSGAILTGVFALLILSGYLLYYVGDDRVRPVISALHWGIGLTCPAFFAWHRVKRRKVRLQSNSLHELNRLP